MFCPGDCGQESSTLLNAKSKMDRAPARKLVSPPVKQMHYRSNSLYFLIGMPVVAMWLAELFSFAPSCETPTIKSIVYFQPQVITWHSGFWGAYSIPFIFQGQTQTVSSLNCLLPLRRPMWRTANTTWAEVITNISAGKSFSHSRLLRSWMAKVLSPGTWWKHWVLTERDRQPGVVSHAYNPSTGRMWLEFSWFRLACVT